MAVEVKCAVYRGDPRVIDKKPELIKSLECRIVKPFDIINPTIIIENDKNVENCNYFVIEKRKYFKAGEKKLGNKMLEIILHEDVLSTWMPKVFIVGAISNASEIVSENMKQNYPLDINTKISRILFANNKFNTVTNNPIVIVQSPQTSINEPT